jgi:hypothetical protein
MVVSGVPTNVPGVVTVQARAGEWLVVHGRVTDTPERVGEIVEVPHGDGSPPYVVRWAGEDHTCVVFPGPDAGVVAERPASAHHG